VYFSSGSVSLVLFLRAFSFSSISFIESLAAGLLTIGF
jgi:hypothetical protein